MNERLWSTLLLVAAAALLILGTVQAVQLQEVRTTIKQDLSVTNSDAPSTPETTTPRVRAPSAPAPTMVGGC